MAKGDIISAVINGETTPHLCDFVPLTKQGIYRRKDVIGDKRKCAGRKKFLEAMQERCLALNLHVWSRKHNLTA